VSGIYIHIPFCKQACHYCDFHFSTSLKKRNELINALKKELFLRAEELKNSQVETIYFGGGTPSLLSADELNEIIEEVTKYYNVAKSAEITLEANPDDLTSEKLIALSQSPINRLSIGVQSFFEADLQLMNRAHNALEAKQCIVETKKYFSNISIDLIYGVPGMSEAQWKENLAIALQLDTPHISSYALTVEPRTALKKHIEKGLIKPVDDEVTQRHFEILVETLTAAGFEHYELSNFAKDGLFSKNNTAYWLGKSYLGIGPSAHSFDGNSRSWNINNNAKYIKAIERLELPLEIENLTTNDKYNEYIMTGLRTQWGISLKKIEASFGVRFKVYLLQEAQKHIEQELLCIENDTLLVTKKGKFLSDGIASDLFLINLN
jgi:oxygen-independent coproporphyrinogen-3 oxidase